jgi:hypothetical protein
MVLAAVVKRQPYGARQPTPSIQPMPILSPIRNMSSSVLTLFFRASPNSKSGASEFIAPLIATPSDSRFSYRA